MTMAPIKCNWCVLKRDCGSSSCRWGGVGTRATSLDATQAGLGPRQVTVMGQEETLREFWGGGDAPPQDGVGGGCGSPCQDPGLGYPGHGGGSPGGGSSSPAGSSTGIVIPPHPFMAGIMPPAGGNGGTGGPVAQPEIKRRLGAFVARARRWLDERFGMSGRGPSAGQPVMFVQLVQLDATDEELKRDKPRQPVAVSFSDGMVVVDPLTRDKPALRFWVEALTDGGWRVVASRDAIDSVSVTLYADRIEVDDDRE